MNYLYCKCKDIDAVLNASKTDARHVFVENGLMPNAQVEKVKALIAEHVKSGKSFSFMTVSPYVVKTVETECDLLEQDLTCLDENGKSISIQDIYYEMYQPLAKLMNGDHFEAKSVED